MTDHDWDSRYRSGDLPWDIGEPDHHLVELVRSGGVAPGRTLEIGCGTGTNARWLAAQGFDVLAIDVSPRAIEIANGHAIDAASRCRFEVLDFLADELPSHAFEFVFDRGVFHVFDEAADRVRFAARVAAVLGSEGRWASLIGSTEGPERDHGPPRRSVRDIAAAIEPALEIIELRSTWFDADLPTAAKAWLCVAGPRAVPAQPSTRR